MGAMTENKIGGLALIIGSIAVIVFTFITPGAGFVDPVEKPTDLFAMVDAMVDNARLTHVTTSLVSLGMVAQLFGIVVLWRNVSGSSNSDALVRLGLSAIFVAVVFLLAGKGMDHITVHVRAHGIGMGAEGSSLETMALTIQSVKGALVITASTIGQIGYIVFGLGMLARFSSMNFNKIAPLAVVVLSLIGLVTTILAEHAHDLIDPIVVISLVIFVVNLLYLAYVGLNLHNGASGYARQE